jgi:alkylation response protein AidB-like acyl-CoA dehydrogenase
MIAETKQLLPEEMLERFRQRAATYDRENRFFQEDFDELVAAGYMKGPIPTEFGGLGLRLGDVCRAQRRVAYYAPATAIAVNMHLYWLDAEMLLELEGIRTTH